MLTLHTNNSVEKQTAKIVTLQWTLRRHLSASAFRRKLSAKNHDLIKAGLDSLPSELFACNSQGHTSAPRADSPVSDTHDIEHSEMESLYGKPVFSLLPTFRLITTPSISNWC